MPIEQIISPEVAEPAPGMWSNCLRVGDSVYVSGLTARDRNQNAAGGDEYAQTDLIFKRMAALMGAAGGSLADIVKLTIFVTNIGNRERVWRARREHFSGAFPACSLVEVSKLAPGIDVEIEAVAILNQGGRPAAA
jgi:enamine deaminase RidA (YjgF/YER057c/UK114 family)